MEMKNSDLMEQGMKAYKDGVDKMHCPSYLTDKEQLEWHLGYELAQFQEVKDLEELEEVEELDFN